MAEGNFVLTRIDQTLVVTLQGAADAGALSAPSYSAGPGVAMSTLDRRHPMDPDTGALKIAGVDTNSGLKRLGGKRERYESLLRKFAGQQAGAVEAIRAALSAGDASTAERGAHSLKGAASTLGATMLAEDAARTETAIKTGQSLNEALESLSHSLTAVVER